MKKIILLGMFLLIIVLSSCSRRNNYKEEYDSIPFLEYTTILVDDATYKIYLAEDMNSSFNYYYYDLKIESNKSEIIVNTIVDLTYKVSDNYLLSDNFLDNIYDIIMDIQELSSFSSSIRKSGEYIIEEKIDNIDNKITNAYMFIAYTIIKIKSDDLSFHLSIPIFSRILKTNNGFIVDPFTSLETTMDEFIQKY